MKLLSTVVTFLSLAAHALAVPPAAIPVVTMRQLDSTTIRVTVTNNGKVAMEFLKHPNSPLRTGPTRKFHFISIGSTVLPTFSGIMVKWNPEVARSIEEAYVKIPAGESFHFDHDISQAYTFSKRSGPKQKFYLTLSQTSFLTRYGSVKFNKPRISIEVAVTPTTTSAPAISTVTRTTTTTETTSETTTHTTTETTSETTTHTATSEPSTTTITDTTTTTTTVEPPTTTITDTTTTTTTTTITEPPKPDPLRLPSHTNLWPLPQKTLRLPRAAERCAPRQVSAIERAGSWANRLAKNAATYLEGVDETDSRYRAWFGKYESNGKRLVRANFKHLVYFPFTTMKYNCLGKFCGAGDYAYVDLKSNNTITICSEFWDSGLFGRNSRAGTLLHEASHFEAYGALIDYTHGEEACQGLAGYKPAGALHNADSYEFFAEHASHRSY